jgi:polyisoprenoid-binding protein YceI
VDAAVRPSSARKGTTRSRAGPTTTRGRLPTVEPYRPPDEQGRHNHFLDTAVHPVLRFHSTRLHPTGQDHWTVAGNLTIRGVTNPITLEARFHGRSPDGGIRLAATTTLNRTTFGVRGDRLLIADTVAVAIHAEVTPIIARKDPR